MKDELTLSYINLYAVLRNLEELCDMDSEAKSLIANKNLSICFKVKNGPQAVLSFQNGKCTFSEGSGPCSIKLYFTSPAHLNSMFEGKANPIPLKGLTKISFLKNEFTKLTERLSFYLKPTDALLKDKNYHRLNTILTANTAIFALSQIGNHDRLGKLNAYRMPDGIISIQASDGSLALNVTADHGVLTPKKGKADKPRAIMEFSDLETANNLLNGKVDAYTCIATGGIKTRGYVPMLDCFDKLLGMVPRYLK
ncbi:MAG: hypothetical protein ACOZCL_17415 [Bacillota bacterium]